MKKHLIGLIFGAIIIVVFCHFSYSKHTSALKLQTDRVTAHARVKCAIAKMRNEIETLDDKAHRYTMEALMLKLTLERKQKKLDQLKETIEKLSATAKDAGLPKPSKIASLTSEQAAMMLTIGWTSIKAREVYSTIERLFNDLQECSITVQIHADKIEHILSIAEELNTQKNEIIKEIAKMETRVAELGTTKDHMEINVELAKLKTKVKGININDHCQALKTLQEELAAMAEIYQNKTQTKQTELNPINSPEPSDKLDVFWERSKTND